MIQLLILLKGTLELASIIGETLERSKRENRDPTPEERATIAAKRKAVEDRLDALDPKP